MSGLISLLKSGFTTDNYYKSMNQALMRLDQEYTMLHYPYYVSDTDGFHTAQKNLTDFCFSRIPSPEGKQLLEIGCGNGMQAIYIMQNYSPARVMGIDLNAANIQIAKGEAEKAGFRNIEFSTGDAQKLVAIKDGTYDFIINIESAFHYPDKPAFIREMARVLKPGGYFLVADILTTPVKRSAFKKFWKRKMHFNHWSGENYEHAFADAGLTVDSYADITEDVIRGFERYKHWLGNMEKGSFFRDLLLKLFYSINVRLNIRLLRKRRRYGVFAGQKN